MTRKAMTAHRVNLVHMLHRFRIEERRREATVVETIIDMLDDALLEDEPAAMLNLDREQLEKL